MLEPYVCVTYLKQPLENLLRDTSGAVKAEITKMISIILSRMHIGDEEHRYKSLASLHPALVDLSKSIGRDWRMDQCFLGALPRYGSSEWLQSHRLDD